MRSSAVSSLCFFVEECLLFHSQLSEDATSEFKGQYIFVLLSTQQNLYMCPEYILFSGFLSFVHQFV